jgi:purine-binding chemotaxis protein CheW
VLVVTIAASRVAFPAARVESVVELDALSPVPRAAPHVAGLSALRSRVLTVIDGLTALGAGQTPAGALANAVVVPSGGHPYALLVESVEDVVEALSEPQPVRAAMEAGWERVGLGMIETEEGPLLLVDIDGLIGGPASDRAAA